MDDEGVFLEPLSNLYRGFVLLNEAFTFFVEGGGGCVWIHSIVFCDLHTSCFYDHRSDFGCVF